jgi:Prim-pol 4/Herpesviridae UL52/UL70 DNA primase
MSIERWRTPKGPGTHVLMDGGILFVPPEDTQEFYREYIQLVNLGTKLYVVEQKTEQFKFFVDLDYKAETKLKEEDLLQFVTIIHSALETRSQCLIARAQPRAVKEGIKSGVHVHWPELVVTRTQAMNFRTKIITSLSEAVPFAWDKVIDASVYGGSGLRMLWSHKIPTGDPYIPWRSLDGREFAKTPDAEILELFAVRTDEQPVDRETLENTGPLEEYIQKYLPGQEQSHVKRVQRCEHNTWFVQSDSKFCERVLRNHQSNHIWFYISGSKISQRCFDEECSEFKGTEHILPPSIVEQLNNVAVVGSPSSGFLMDIFPDGTRETIQEVRKAHSSVLGSGSRKLGEVSRESPRVRTVGFDPPW